MIAEERDGKEAVGVLGTVAHRPVGVSMFAFDQ